MRRKRSVLTPSFGVPDCVENCYQIDPGTGRVRIPVRLHYDGIPNLNASVVGESLVALDEALHRSSPVFANISGCKKRKKVNCSVTVSDIKEGTLSETLIVDIGMGGVENARAFVCKLAGNINTLNPAAIPVVIGLITGAVLTTAAVYAIKKLKKQPPETSTMITANNSIVLTAARNLNIDGNAFKALVDKVAGTNVFAKKAIIAMTPAKGGTPSTLTINPGEGSVTIPGQAIAEMPEVAELEMLETSKEIPFDAVDLKIVASDGERLHAGWAAYLPDDHAYGGVRIKLELAEAVPIPSMMYRQTVKCSGTLSVAFSSEKNSFTPKVIRVTKTL